MIPLSIFVVIFLWALAYYLFIQDFWAVPTGDRLDKIKNSPHFRDGVFHNMTKTILTTAGFFPKGMIKDTFQKSPRNRPRQPLPVQHTDLKKINGDKPTLVWFGHSSYLIVSDGFRVLMDPVLGPYASPLVGIAKAFQMTYDYSAKDFPELDVICLSHDHYDHLDYEAIIGLAHKTKLFVTALGVWAHLERRGIPAEKIVELDRYESQQIAPDVSVTATPARHFSGRGIQRAKSFWASFVLDLKGQRIFMGGDSGYGHHFKDIGKKFGPFDLAILECGQYGEYRPNIHMTPQETIQASHDLWAKLLLPVHRGKFALSFHGRDESIEIALAEASRTGQTVLTPWMWEPLTLDGSEQGRRRWEGLL